MAQKIAPLLTFYDKPPLRVGLSGADVEALIVREARPINADRADTPFGRLLIRTRYGLRKINNMWPFKFNKLPYTNPNRLADVLALIQVLALDKYRHRSDEGLTDEMQGPPRSGSNWKEIAQQHPEFFRVSKTEKLGVSLVATHVLPKDVKGNRELPSDFVSILLQTAINLHDRQLDRARHWRVYIPIVVAVVAGAFTLFGIFLKSWLQDP